MGTKAELAVKEFGAAQRVAGSHLLFKIGSKFIAIDRGLFYDNKLDSLELPYKPSMVEAMIFSHAHADHLGKFPDYVKNGFKGDVFCTEQTADIAKIQFSQELGSSFMHNNYVRQHNEKVKATGQGSYLDYQKSEYEKGFLKKVMELFKSYNDFEKDEGSRFKNNGGFPYKQPIQITDKLEITFFEAGHIPGSAQVLMKMKKDNGRKVNVLYTGDLGRTDYKIARHKIADTPIVKFPEKDFGDKIDYAIVESTYGDKVHKPIDQSLDILLGAIHDSAKKGGHLVIPAFSIMRTHMLLNFIYRAYTSGELPKFNKEFMKFYLSSPTAVKIGKIIAANEKDLDDVAIKEFAEEGNNPFDFPALINHEKRQETLSLLQSTYPDKGIQINYDKEYTKYVDKNPWGIMAASGMCDFGRIVPILRYTIDDPKNIILLTGYTAPGTKGNIMLNAKKGDNIPFYSQPYEMKHNEQLVTLNADVRRMSGLSGHADCKEMIEHLKNIQDTQKSKLKGIYIKHGEKESTIGLKKKLIEAGFDRKKIHIMQEDRIYEFR